MSTFTDRDSQHPSRPTSPRALPYRHQQYPALASSNMEMRLGKRRRLHHPISQQWDPVGNVMPEVLRYLAVDTEHLHSSINLAVLEIVF